MPIAGRYRTIGAEPPDLQNHDVPGDLFGLSKMWPNILQHRGRRDLAVLCDKVFVEHNNKNYCEYVHGDYKVSFQTRQPMHFSETLAFP